MAEIKTKVNDADVLAFIGSVEDETKRNDSLALLDLYTTVTGEPARMWGSSIVGFGSYHYKSERSSQEGDWMRVGFSPRKQNLTLYFMDGFEHHSELLARLGKHKLSKGCVYINKLADIDTKVLEQLITDSLKEMKKLYP